MGRMSLRRRLQILASENVKFREALLGEMRRVATTWPRRTYLPHSARDKEPFIPPGTDLEIWAWEDAGKIYGAAFAGKANKPLWQWRFPSEARRQQEIDSTIQRRKEHFADKERKQKERREYEHGLEVGTMLYRSGGYDQTNVDFYQVTKIVGKQIEIRKVEKKIVREEKTSVYVVPVPNKFKGPPKRKTPQRSGHEDSYVKMDNGYAYVWDGKPRYETAAGYGH